MVIKLYDFIFMKIHNMGRTYVNRERKGEKEKEREGWERCTPEKFPVTVYHNK